MITETLERNAVNSRTPTPREREHYLKQRWLASQTDSGNGLLWFGTGFDLMWMWFEVDATEDAGASGVLADWLEENLEEMVAHGNPRPDVEYCLHKLRLFAANPDRNGVGAPTGNPGKKET